MPAAALTHTVLAQVMWFSVSRPIYARKCSELAWIHRIGLYWDETLVCNTKHSDNQEDPKSEGGGRLGLRAPALALRILLVVTVFGIAGPQYFIPVQLAV